MALFEPEFGLVFWMLVVFLILFAILAKYAWPFIIKSIEERAEFIDNGVKYTQEAINRKNQAETDAKVLLTEAQKRQLEILQEAQRMKQEIISDAKKAAGVEAQKVLDAAKLSAEQVKKEAELQMRKQVSLLSLEIAEKVIRRDLSNDEEQERLIGTFLDEIENKN